VRLKNCHLLLRLVSIKNLCADMKVSMQHASCSGTLYICLHYFVLILFGFETCSDTMPLRKEKILNADVYLVHARLEMEVNCCVDVALNILQLARVAYPECIKEYSFVHLLTQILVRVGDLAQIQSILHVALGDDAFSVGNIVTNNIGPLFLFIRISLITNLLLT